MMADLTPVQNHTGRLYTDERKYTEAEGKYHTGKRVGSHHGGRGSGTVEAAKSLCAPCCDRCLP